MVSSRTPEGEPNRCPTCGAAVCIEPSRPFDDAPCPNCGTLLWFLRRTDASVILRALPANDRSRLLEILADQLGTAADEEAIAHALEAFEGDSLDLVELVMELEDELESEGSA